MKTSTITFEIPETRLQSLVDDLQESIKYYQDARKRGKEIKGPTDRSPQPGKP